MYGFNSVPMYKDNFKDKLRYQKWKFFRKQKNISEPVLDNGLKLKQTFSLISNVLEVKDIEENNYIGYGTSTFTKEKIKVAIVDIGYADGINKKRTNSNVQINGNLYPIIGDVCMGMIIVKVDDKVKPGDKVIVIGDKVGILYVANYLGTTAHDTMTMIDSSIERKYRRDK